MNLNGAKDTHEIKSNHLIWKLILPIPSQNIICQVLSIVTNLDALGKIIVEQNDLYAQQNDREFQTNNKEMKALLGMSYVMSVNHLIS